MDGGGGETGERGSQQKRHKGREGTVRARFFPTFCKKTQGHHTQRGPEAEYVSSLRGHGEAELMHGARYQREPFSLRQTTR